LFSNTPGHLKRSQYFTHPCLCLTLLVLYLIMYCLFGFFVPLILVLFSSTSVYHRRRCSFTSLMDWVSEWHRPRASQALAIFFRGRSLLFFDVRAHRASERSGSSSCAPIPQPGARLLRPAPLSRLQPLFFIVLRRPRASRRSSSSSCAAAEDPEIGRASWRDRV
jgi:hypothetical protein